MKTLIHSFIEQHAHPQDSIIERTQTRTQTQTQTQTRYLSR